jgi:hypothetical protein
MGSINRYLLALATLVLFVPFGAASAQSPTTSVETQYLMTLEATCEPGQPMGQRLVSALRELKRQVKRFEPCLPRPAKIPPAGPRARQE